MMFPLIERKSQASVHLHRLSIKLPQVPLTIFALMWIAAERRLDFALVMPLSNEASDQVHVTRKYVYDDPSWPLIG
ncbi:hypothetical protein D3C79_843250 [compost metagenome]